MVKYEIKIDLINNTDSIRELVEKSYFLNNNGKISNDKCHMIITQDDQNWEILKDLNGNTFKAYNEIVDGSIRFMIESDGINVKLHPISIYCIKDNNKYIFH